MSTILDFQIQSINAESYSLTVCERSSSQSLASAIFSHRVDFLTDFNVDRLNASTKDPAERFDELQKLGRELYQKLFPPAVEQVWQKYKQRSEFLILCLRFAEDAAKLEVLPWETLHDGAEFIAAGAKTTLTRLPLDVAPPSELPPIPRPLKLFGFFASPLDLGDHERLKAEREQEILLEAINDPNAQGRISVEIEDEAKLEILERSLKDGYHILHFTGHGISPRDGGGLLLEDAQGKKLPVSIADVMQAVERGQEGKAKLRLAVISGCQTARTLHTGAFNDLARELLRQRVPAVIAMQFSISDDGGLKFAEVLYREIAKGTRLERAVHTARRVLLADEKFFINNDALAIVLLAADGACLRTTEAQSSAPQAEPGATYLGDRLDPLKHGFYGRRREYRQIRDALLHQDQRAVIIHGIGGIGKTALLTHAINRLRPRFKDVMSFDCRRAALAPETILLELHRYFATQGMPQLQSLIGQNVPPETLANEIAKLLTEWPLLIVFDNFESQLDERRAFLNEDLRVFLATLVRATTTGSRFLFTTRYLFDLDGERLGNLQELPLGDLSRAEALMLMQKLPNLAQAAYRDKLAVLEKFGGHPSALVLLNQLCSSLALEQILRDASLLESELREFLAIELTYRRLSDNARDLLCRVAAFRAIVPLAAVEWVMSNREALPPEELLAALAEFRRSDAPKDLRMMDDATILAIFERAAPMQQQHIDVTQPIRELIHWGALFAQFEGGLLTKVAVHSLVRDFCRTQLTLETWQERLRDAASYYIEQTKLMEQDEKSQADVWGEMEAVGLLLEAEAFEVAADYVQLATPLLTRWGYGRFLETIYSRLIAKVPSGLASVLAQNHGVILQNRGDYDAALNKFNQALTFSRALAVQGDFTSKTIMSSTLYHIGRIEQERGADEVALQRYEDSRKVAQEIENHAGAAAVLHQIGNLHFQHGRYEVALRQYNEALGLMEGLGNRAGVAAVLSQIGQVEERRSKHERALERYEASLKIMKELGNRMGEANLLHSIGYIHQMRGDNESALRHYDTSLKISEELGNRAGVAHAHAQIGQLFMQFGSYPQAFSLLLLALTTFTELQSTIESTVIDMLKELRTRWGPTNFDVAWREAKNQEPPERLKR